jgi:hypothetical protein
LYVGGFASAGLAIGDLNGDGLPDIVLGGGPVKNRLYLQDGNGSSAAPHFRDVTEQAEIGGGDAWGAGVTLVDIDNDRDLDIYICNYDSANELYINETTSPDAPRFVESAHQFGLDLVDASFMSTFCDYDRDGDLDVFVVGYQYIDPSGRPKDPPVIQQNGRYYVKPGYRKYYGIVEGAGGKPTFTNVGRQDYLLRSNAAQSTDGTIRFTDVTSEAGIQGLGVGNSVVWWDYNDDGLPDIYIANDFKVADQLYRNNGNGSFTDVIRDTFSHTTWFSMGCETGDVNNDGMIDLLVSDMAGTTHYRSKVTMGDMGTSTTFMKTAEPRQFMRNALFINTGTPRFLEAAYLAGVANSDWTWATKLADFDNDGRLDAYFTNGSARMFNHSDHKVSDADQIGRTQWDIWEDTEPRREENLAFRNSGNLRFENVSTAWGLHHKGMSYAAAYGDLDNDGDLDLVVVNLDEPVSIYRNNSTNGHRLRVKLQGNKGNRDGIGAKLTLYTADGMQSREMTPVMGFLSCNAPDMHFGLGNAARVDRLVIQWPSGIRQELTDLNVDQLYTVHEPDESNAQPVAPDNALPVFKPSRRFPALKHTELDFDDFARQPLLPFKHSQLGPGLALGDIDADGDADVYMSRGKGGRRAVYTNDGQAKLTVKSLTAFQSDNEYEDMGALFFDADLDGDRDLYVVSGGVECEPDDALLRDRLYLNEGDGVFGKAADDVLPDVRDSGSVVCAADYDRDGDLDLFVGGRVVPGQYPVTPNSRLLENISQPGNATFRDSTDAIAVGLRTTGMVTSAVWSDADGDGWVDLMVTHDWGPVKYYRNEAREPDATSARRLTDRTQDAGLADLLGWWNGIAARDLDNDGDTDYVVTNFGLNTTYHASREKPELLYYGDFDGSGKAQLIEAKFENDKCFPRRGLSCSSRAMPFIRTKMQTFHNFGLATLSEIYTDERLSHALRFEANLLESGVLVNLGPAGSQTQAVQFRFQPLPPLAQISPAFGVVLTDFDADGLVDCFLTHNFYSPQLETGRMDSGLSILLRGKGAAKDGAIDFETVWPKQSGIIIPRDAKAASTVDFNEDGWDDLLITVNDGTIEAFERVADPQNRLLRVRLIGPAGNPDCFGAAVTVSFAGDSTPSQTSEVIAGGGYLSQSFGGLEFGCGTDRQPSELRVRWPNGQVSSHRIASDQFEVTVTQP